MSRTKRKLNKPSVTIIIPVRGRAEWAGEAVRSVLGQKGQLELKVIVVDDSDDGQKIPGADDNRVVVIRNRGKHHPSVSRNFGLSKTKSEYVGFLDYDDYYSPAFLSECVRTLRRSPEVTSAVVLSNKIFSSKFSFLSKTKIVLFNIFKDFILVLHYLFKKPLSSEWSYLLQLSHQLFRRAAISRTRFRPNLPFCEDWYFSEAVLRNGGAMVIPKRITNYRYSSSSNTFHDTKRITKKSNTYKRFYKLLARRYPSSLGVKLFRHYCQFALIKNA